jgi:hypothetical protein
MTFAKGRSLYVAFGGRQVAVHSDLPEILSHVSRSFRAMLVDRPTEVVGHLEILKDGEAYYLKGSAHTSAREGSWVSIIASLNYEVAAHLIRARSDLLWLHAGASAPRDRAVLFPGQSGRGKSTVVSNLGARGWTYLSDDIIPLDLITGRVSSFPRTPTPRINKARGTSPGCPPELDKVEVHVESKQICRSDISVVAIVFPNYDRDSQGALIPCAPALAALKLLDNSLNFADHRHAAIASVCNLVRRVPSFNLQYSDGSHAADLVTRASASW